MARADDQTARPEGGGGGRSGGGGGGVGGGVGGSGGGGGGGNVRGGNLSSTAPHKVPKLRLEIDPQHFDLLNEMQLKDAWRVAALRLPSAAAATTAATATSTSTNAAAAAAAAALLPPGASGVQLRPLPLPRGSGNFTPYLFVDFPLMAMAHGTHPQPPTVLCLDAVSATALFREEAQAELVAMGFVKPPSAPLAVKAYKTRSGPDLKGRPGEHFKISWSESNHTLIDATPTRALVMPLLAVGLLLLFLIVARVELARLRPALHHARREFHADLLVRRRAARTPHLHPREPAARAQRYGSVPREPVRVYGRGDVLH